jgi:hypothetical protein
MLLLKKSTTHDFCSRMRDTTVPLPLSFPGIRSEPEKHGRDFHVGVYILLRFIADTQHI